MDKRAVIAVSVLLIVALAIPTYAGVSYKKGGSIYGVASKIYSRSTSILADTEGHVPGILRNTFGLFNPCLDLIKGCSTVVLAPVEVPLRFVTDSISKPTRRSKRAVQKIPVPKKPKIPAK